jgi:HEAT repeat protein
VRRSLAIVGALSQRPLLLACIVIPGMALLLMLINWASSGTAEPAKKVQAVLEEPPAPTSSQRFLIEGWASDLRNQDAVRRGRAVEEMRKLGKAAQPAELALIDALADDTPVNGNELVCDVAGQTLAIIGAPAVVPLAAALKIHQSGRARVEAARTLGNIGVEARSAIPALQAALGDDSTRVHAAYALWQIDPQAKLIVPTLFSHPQLPMANLIEALSHKNVKVSGAAAAALSAMGPAAQEAVPALVQALHKPEARIFAAKALRSLARSLDVGGAVPSLVEMLGDSDERVRKAAAQALARIAPKDRTVAVVLARALADSNLDVRVGACHTLGAMGPAAEPAFPALVDMLGRGDYPHLAASALVQIGPAARPVVPALIALIEERKTGKIQESARAAVWALGAIGPADQVLPTLLQILEESQNVALHDSAADAMARLGPAAGKALPALIRDAEAKWPEVHPSTVAALGQMGPEAVPVLGRVLKDAPARSRALAAETLGAMGAAAKAAVPALRNALHDREPRVALEAAFALCQLDADPQYAREVIVQAVRDEPFRGVMQFRPGPELSRRIQKVGPVLLPALVDLLKDSNTPRQLRAIDAIAAMGPAAKPAIPALLPLARDSDVRVRDAAALALVQVIADVQDALAALRALAMEPSQVWMACKLAQFGPAARVARPELLDLLGSPDARAASLLALEAVGAPTEQARPTLEWLLLQQIPLVDYVWPPTNVVPALAKIAIPKARAALSFPPSEEKEFAAPTVLEQSRISLSERAMGVLAVMGPGTKGAWDTLLQDLEAEPVPVRQAAFAALRLVAPQTAAAVKLPPQKLQAAWEDLREPDEEKAYQAVWTLIVHPGSSVPWLRDHLRSAEAIPRSEHLRALRAVSVLERSGSGEARALLERLAQRPTYDPLAPAAQAALDRLAKTHP